MTPQFLSAKSFFDNQKTPVSLIENIWFENTTVLFHSPRFLKDKTQAALAMAEHVADKGHNVLYISTEPTFGKNRASSENLFIFTPQFESIDDKRDYADLVFEAIEHAIRSTPIRTFVIDSITRIAALSFGRNASAAYVMKRLVAMQVKCRLSMLVLADDTTKSSTRALVSLASAEITPDPEADDAPRASLSQMAYQLGHGHQQLPPEPLPVCRPASEAPLNRQQRRALQRQQARR